MKLIKHVDNLKQIHFFGGVTLLGYLLLAFASQYAIQGKLIVFMSVNLYAWLCLMIFFYSYKESSKNNNVLFALVTWAILFQLPAIFINPILDDDYFRYLWDGYIFATTGNPYIVIPADYFILNLPDDINAILSRINYPNVPTIYGPFCQYIFLLVNFFRPHQLIFLKSILLCLNVASIFIMSTLVRERMLLLFAWCPLLITQSVYELHIDVVGVFMLLLAMYCYQRSKNENELASNSTFMTAIFLASAMATKIVALPITLLMMMRYQFKYWLVLLSFLILLYMPFYLLNKVTSSFEMSVFFTQWQFNGSVFEVLQYMMGSTAGRLVTVSLFLLLFLYITKMTWKENGVAIPRGDLVFGFFFLLAPVVNPWYLLWLLPFATIYPALWSWTALFAVNLSYINGYYFVCDNLAPYQIPFYVQCAEYMLIFIAVCIDIYRHRVSAE